MNSIGLLTALLLITTQTSHTHLTSGVEDVSWRLTWIGGQRLTITSGRPAPTVLLTGADHRVSANTGCNDISGTYEMEGASLRFDALDATKRLCTDPVLTQREKLLLRALNETRSWQAKGNTLTLTGAGGELARFERKSEPVQ